MTKNEIFYDTDRRALHSVLPLMGPFSANIEVSSICNINCKYCLHSLGAKEVQKVHPLKNMDVSLFENIMEQFKMFPQQLEKLVINGVGEPLCNPKFPEILSIAKLSKASKKVEFFTNGTLLTRSLSHEIVKTGVDRIKISLQGLNSKVYKDVCGKEIDYQELYDNISYLASIKGNTELFIKIIDIGVNGDSQHFFEQFSFADRLFIEHVEPWFDEVDYKDIYHSDRDRETISNKYGKTVRVPQVCPVPFYRVYIDVEGNVFYCYSIRRPAEILNCTEQPLLSIWNSAQRNSFLTSMLRNGRSCNEVCNRCTMMCDAAFNEQDNLDDYCEDILHRFLGGNNQ